MKKMRLILLIILALSLLFIPNIAMAANITLIEADSPYDLSAHSHIAGDVVTISTGQTVTLKNSPIAGVRVVCISNVNLTVENVTLISNDITGAGAAIEFQSGINTLKLIGTSKVTSSIFKAGIQVENATQLTINGPGQITANGDGFPGINGGAGIGGSSSSSGGIITINSGTIIANGGSTTAGIGGSYNGAGGTITINGGTITATGGDNGAGIGGGYSGAGGTITINGGAVTAKGGTFAAGIGGGLGGGGATVVISGNALVFANGDVAGGAQDIGRGSSNPNAGTLSISGTAEVFLSDAIGDSVTPTAPEHSIEPTTRLTTTPMTGVGKLYNFKSPAGWEADANSGYFIYRVVSNPQSGQETDYTWLLVSAILFTLLGGLVLLKR
jgi:hypothetical protein